MIEVVSEDHLSCAGLSGLQSIPNYIRDVRPHSLAHSKDIWRPLHVLKSPHRVHHHLPVRHKVKVH